MTNVLTSLVPHAYNALDTISRELNGFIPAAMTHSSFDRAAKDQSVIVPITPDAVVEDISPAMTIPEPAGQTIENVPVQITKFRASPFAYTGEETMQLNAGPGFLGIQAQQISQSIRVLVNEMETDLGRELALNSCRAIGTIGTTPFVGNIDASADLKKELDDNGAPTMMRSIQIDTTVGAALGKNTQLNRVDQSGDMDLLRRGYYGSLHGFEFRQTGFAYTHTPGTATGKLINSAPGYSAGSTTFLTDGGSGTLLAGDIVTFAGHTDKYVVSRPLTNNRFSIHKPGLVESVANDEAITRSAGYTASIGHSMNALVLACRRPALPQGGDIGSDRFEMMDPRSGLVFEVAHYHGYRRNRYEVSMAWGVKGIKPEHSVLLIH